MIKDLCQTRRGEGRSLIYTIRHLYYDEAEQIMAVSEKRLVMVSWNVLSSGSKHDQSIWTQDIEPGLDNVKHRWFLQYSFTAHSLIGSVNQPVRLCLKLVLLFQIF